MVSRTFLYGEQISPWAQGFPGCARSSGARRYFQAYDGKPIIFQVKGILSPESELLSSDLMLIAAADFRRLFGIPEGSPPI